MERASEEWAILGIRQLAATDERAEEFRGGSSCTGRAAPTRSSRSRCASSAPCRWEMDGDLARVLARSRGR